MYTTTWMVLKSSPQSWQLISIFFKFCKLKEVHSNRMDSNADIIIIFKPGRNSQHTLFIIIPSPWTLRRRTSSNNNRSLSNFIHQVDLFSMFRWLMATMTVCVCVCVLPVAIHAACRHLSGQTGPSKPLRWDQSFGSFSARPYHFSHILLIKHV